MNSMKTLIDTGKPSRTGNRIILLLALLNSVVGMVHRYFCIAADTRVVIGSITGASEPLSGRGMMCNREYFVLQMGARLYLRIRS